MLPTTQLTLSFSNNVIELSSASLPRIYIGPQISTHIGNRSICCMLHNIIPKLLINILREFFWVFCLWMCCLNASHNVSRQLLIQWAFSIDIYKQEHIINKEHMRNLQSKSTCTYMFPIVSFHLINDNMREVFCTNNKKIRA